MHFAAFIFLISLIFTSTISSCNKGNKTAETKDTAVVESIIKDISYGSDTSQTLDTYLPANRDIANTKVLVFIHGGGWSGGDKSDFNEAINALRPKLPGYAIFNINYRLAFNNENRFPSQLNDLKSALEFIESKADEYGVNAKKVGLIGASAGAHLALIQAYKNNSAGKIKAVVDLFGPTDLRDLYTNHPVPQQARYLLMNLMHKTPMADVQLYHDASPINFVNTRSVPTLIFHGANDIVVPVSQSNLLKAKLLANNIKVQMTAYANEGHGWYGKNLLDTYSKTIQFIKENVY